MTGNNRENQDIPLRERLAATPAAIAARATPNPDQLSVRDGSSGQRGPGRNDKPDRLITSVALQRSIYIVFLTFLYGAAALYAWVIICILTDHPIGGTSYGLGELDHLLDHPQLGSGTVPEYLNELFAKSERYLRAARIVQSLVTVLTIPLTSAVCSQAAVVYLQRKRGTNRPTLRQSMALADKGWTDIKILSNLMLGGWKKYWSSLLILAALLHLLGAAISPIQQIFLSYNTIKRIGYPVSLTQITDFTDLFPSHELDDGVADSGFDTTKLRASLAATVNDEVQPRLWSSSNGTVSFDEKSRSYWVSSSSFQTKSQNTFENITSITDPFWAELPSGTNTGLLQRYAPRINSTARWENNSASVLPEDCNSSSDAYYLRYVYEDVFQYDIEICMPGNMSESPWKNQMMGQDFSEELYLKMNFSGHFQAAISNLVVPSGIYSRKLTLHTTTGYFELPNYANGQVPGPLIKKGPFVNSPRNLTTRSFQNDTAWATLNATTKMRNVANKSPLLGISMALFGEGSFVDAQHTTMAAYADSGVIEGGCIDIVPFISLLGDSYKPVPFHPCLMGLYFNDNSTTNWQEDNEFMMHAIIAAYFSTFSGVQYGPTSDQVQNAFTSAAFLANDMMMTNNYQTQSIEISYDMGADVTIPRISRAGIIFISVLLALDLAFLLALAIYSAWIPRWTGTLDSFAMMRIGASISERVPLLATNDDGSIRALDETPGWMGNASNGEIGELCLGGEGPLAKTKRYEGYDDDRLAKATETRKIRGVVRREGYSLAPEQDATSMDSS